MILIVLWLCLLLVSWKVFGLFCGSNVSRASLSLINTLVFSSLFFVQLQRFFRFEVNTFATGLCILIYLLMVVLVYFVVKKKAVAVPTKEKVDLIFVALLTLIGGFLVYKIFIDNEALAAPDALRYLHESALIVRSPDQIDSADRSVVHAIPALFYIHTGLSLELGYKLLSCLLFLLSSFAIYSLSTKILDQKWSLVSVVLTLSSLIFWELLWGMYANLLGLALLIGVVDLLATPRSKNNPKFTLVLITMVVGSLFNIHGIVAFSSLFILLPSVFVYLIKGVGLNVKVLKVFPVLLFLLVFMGLPWISKGWNSVYSLAIKPMVTNTSSIVSESSFNLENGPAIKDQVRHLDYKYFYNNYGATYSGLALLGVLFMLVSLTDKKSVNRYSKFMVVSPIVMLFVLTHQTYFGLTMFTARYAMFLGMFISLLVAYALMRLSVLLITTNKKQPINEWFVFLGLVFVSTVGSFGYWSETVDFVNDGFRADISNQYRDFYKTFGEYVGKDDQVVVFANYDKYASGLWPDKNIEPVNRDWICNPQIEKSSKRIESLSLAFGAETNPTDSLMLFEKELGSNYLVLIDLNEKCLNQELFRAEDYGVLTASKNLVLLERLPSSSF